MSLRGASLSVVLFAFGLLCACTRPYYREVVQPEGSSQKVKDGQVLMMTLVNPRTGRPIPGAKVFAGTGRTRLAVMSDEQGRIGVPVSQTLLEENPLVEVVLPKGVTAYQFQVVHSEPAPAPPPAAPAAPAAPAPEETNSTGSVAPASSSSPETPAVPPPSPNAWDGGA